MPVTLVRREIVVAFDLTFHICRAVQFLITFTRTEPAGSYLYEDRAIGCET